MPTPVPAALRRYPVRFDGDVASYRGLWARSTALMLLSLSLYFPWAYAQRMRYLCGHTELAGARLDYHVVPHQLLIGNVLGYVLINALFYAAAQTGALAPYLVGGLQLLVTLAVPAFLAGYAQFDLGHTSWGGQRLAVVAPPREALRTMGPPTLAYLLFAVLLVLAVADWQAGRGSRAAALAAAGVPGLAFAGAWTYARYRLFLHRHVRVPGLPSLDADRSMAVPVPPGELALCLHTAALATAALLVCVLPLALWLGPLLGLNLQRLELPAQPWSPASWALSAWAGALVAAGLVAVIALPYPYLAAHLQNRLWSATAGDGWHFCSQLHAGAYLRLVLKNTALTLATLGWHFPAGMMAAARMRTEAISLQARPDLVDAALRTLPAGTAAGAARRPTL